MRQIKISLACLFENNNYIHGFLFVYFISLSWTFYIFSILSIYIQTDFNNKLKKRAPYEKAAASTEHLTQLQNCDKYLRNVRGLLYWDYFLGSLIIWYIKLTYNILMSTFVIYVIGMLYNYIILEYTLRFLLRHWFSTIFDIFIFPRTPGMTR